MVAPAIIAAGITAAGSLAGTGLQMLGQGGSAPSDGTFLQNQFNAQMNWNREQMAKQEEFAKMGIRWRVEDAKAAGLHPLAAIGAAGASYSPTALVGTGEPAPGSRARGPDWQDFGSRMGQDISRAYMAAQPPEAKLLTAFELSRQAQQLEAGGLNNDLLKLQILKATNDIATRGLPANAGFTNSGYSGSGVGPIGSPMMGPYGPFESQPSPVGTSQLGQPQTAGGPPGPERRFMSVDGRLGSVAAYPSKDLNIDEITSPGAFGWLLRNKMLPYVDPSFGRPPNSMLPPGAIGWEHNFGTWQPKYFSDLPERPSDNYRPRYTRTPHQYRGRQGDYR